MSKLPEPVAYVEYEGGYYERWVPYAIRKREADAWQSNFPDGYVVGSDEHMRAKEMWRQVPKNPPKVHAIFFDDGSVLDTVNGWRQMTDAEKVEMKRHLNLILGEVIDNQLAIDQVV